MPNKIIGLMVVAALATPSWAHAYGAAYHSGYTHVGPNGAYHAGTTTAVGGAYRPGYGGTAYHAGYTGTTGVRYGTGGVNSYANHGYGTGSTAGRVNYTNFGNRGGTVSTHATAAVILACTLGGLLAGSLVRYLLPDHHTRDDSKDVMKTAAGMMATLVALIIGLLVSSAKGTFDATTASITQGGAKIITLDRVLAKYGPDAAGARGALRHAVAAGVERIWPADRAAGRDLPGAAAATGMEDVFDLVRGLTPRDDAQQYLKSQAVQLSADLMQSRWMLVEQSQNEMPAVFLGVLTAWLAVLFAGLGLLAPRNPTAYGALAVCAASMAGAVYLILELSHPLDGVIQVSGAPLHKALSVLGK